jgi:hypothetical protein
MIITLVVEPIHNSEALRQFMGGPEITYQFYILGQLGRKLLLPSGLSHCDDRELGIAAAQEHLMAFGFTKIEIKGIIMKEHL